MLEPPSSSPNNNNDFVLRSRSASSGTPDNATLKTKSVGITPKVGVPLTWASILAPDEKTNPLNPNHSISPKISVSTNCVGATSLPPDLENILDGLRVSLYVVWFIVVASSAISVRSIGLAPPAKI